MARLPGAAATLLALHGAVGGAAPAPGPPLSPAVIPVIPLAASAPSADGSFPVTLNLNVNLTGIHPLAAQGTLLCSARTMSKPAIDAELSKLRALSGSAAHAEYGSFLEFRAHYLSQQASATFSVSGGTAAVTQPIAIKVRRDDLVDTTTKRLIDQPAVMVGCWLSLANAAGQGGFAYQVASVAPNATGLDAMLQVTSSPYVVASASVPNG
jgi:hypothetical protein